MGQVYPSAKPSPRSIFENWEALFNEANALAKRGLWEQASLLFLDYTRRRRRPGAAHPGALPDFKTTAVKKLKLDRDQLSYLLDDGVVGPEFMPYLNIFDALLNAVPAGEDRIIQLPPQAAGQLAPIYNRLVHLEPAERLKDGALSSHLDGTAIEAAYFASTPGWTVLDDFLKPEALATLRTYFLKSTIWFNIDYANGAVQAQYQEGFHCPLLLQIADELRALLPRLLGDNPLESFWAFIYDQAFPAFKPHIDYAAVQANFWLTPDEACMEPEEAGLVIWDQKIPADWRIDKYGTDHGRQGRIQDFITTEKPKNHKIKYRCNRLVLFDSHLIHGSGHGHFSDGYENRRINTTLLYGKPDEG